MHIRYQSIFRYFVILPVLILGLMPQNAFTASAQTTSNKIQRQQHEQKNLKLNICSYNSKSLDELQKLVRSKSLGQQNFNIAKIFLNSSTEKPPNNKKKRKIEDLQKFTGIPARFVNGFVYAKRYQCVLPSGNKNEWTITILESETGVVEMAEIALSYNDENLLDRQESINSRHYRSYRNLAKTLENLAEKKRFGRRKLSGTLKSGGFIFHRTCVNEDTVSDIFVVPPVPPESIAGLLGVYMSPNARTNVSITYNKDNRKLKFVQPAIGRGSGECKLKWDLYIKQSRQWIEDRFPESWAAEKIRNSSKKNK